MEYDGIRVLIFDRMEESVYGFMTEWGMEESVYGVMTEWGMEESVYGFMTEWNQCMGS